MNESLQTIAQQLHQITGSENPVPPKVVEAIRLLHVVQAEAVKDPGLVQIAARASLLGHQIELFYIRGKGALP